LASLEYYNIFALFPFRNLSSEGWITPGNFPRWLHQENEWEQKLKGKQIIFICSTWTTGLRKVLLSMCTDKSDVIEMAYIPSQPWNIAAQTPNTRDENWRLKLSFSFTAFFHPLIHFLNSSDLVPVFLEENNHSIKRVNFLVLPPALGFLCSKPISL
jgi:hypothetical protein